ncbi:MAG: single-stranded DNA-binding protein [Clostridiales bacterium]|jgi:single-strand DNA-binding protein|nr:single-stranded DNA-binding protein [Clostridiales bacterium]
MNKIMLIGNLTRDPELRTTPNGVSVCSITIAVNRRFAKDEKGEAVTDFFRVTAWRGLGENCAKYLSKGKKIAVIGEVSIRTYETKDGKTGASLEVQAEDIEFLTPRSQGEHGDSGARYSPQDQSEYKAPDGFVDIEDDELPF